MTDSVIEHVTKYSAGDIMPLHQTLPWRLDFAQAAVEYLGDCHPQSDVHEEIVVRFQQIFRRLQAFGPGIGMPHVRKIRSRLWEARVDHRTGAYRMFFGCGSNRTLAFACGKTKKSRRFPPDVYDWAENQVAQHLGRLP